MSIFTKILNKEYLTEKEKNMYISFFHCIEKMDDIYIYNAYKEQFETYELLNKDEVEVLGNYLKKSGGNKFLNINFNNDKELKEYVVNVIIFIIDKFNDFNLNFTAYNLNENTDIDEIKLTVLENYENVLNNIVFKEFLNEDFFKKIDFNTFNYKLMFESFIIGKSNCIYQEAFDNNKNLYKESFIETNNLFDNININILKKVKDLLNFSLKDEKEKFNYCIGLTQNDKSQEFKFHLIKKIFLNDDNLLNFKNPSELITSKQLNKCLNFIEIKSLYFNVNYKRITNDIEEHIFDIIDYVNNSKNNYENVLNSLFDEYYINFLYLIKISDLDKYKEFNLNFNENKIKFFNKIGVNTNNMLNKNFLMSNILTIDFKNNHFFINNQNLINNENFLLLIKHIIQNHNKIKDIICEQFNNNIINNIDELVNLKKENEISKKTDSTKYILEELMNLKEDENLIDKKFRNTINSVFKINSNVLEKKIKDKLNKLENDDLDKFINKNVNEITKSVLENIFYIMCFVNNDLFEKIKEENLFNLFIENYKSVFKYPIDENKMSYDNMLTNIKNINNDLMLNNPNLNIIDRLNYFKEILNDFKNVKAKKIKI